MLLQINTNSIGNVLGRSCCKQHTLLSLIEDKVGTSEPHQSSLSAKIRLLKSLQKHKGGSKF